MFGIGPTEIVLVLVIAVIVFGPKRLPELGKQIGHAMGELRKVTGGLNLDLDLEPVTASDSEAADDTRGNTSPPAAAHDAADNAPTLADDQALTAEQATADEQTPFAEQTPAEEQVSTEDQAPIEGQAPAARADAGADEEPVATQPAAKEQSPADAA
jgi:TatA/E family protein of Tat protein translocase